MSFIKRYSNIRRGGIVFTGNTLGLSKLTNANRAGTQGSKSCNGLPTCEPCSWCKHSCRI